MKHSALLGLLALLCLPFSASQAQPTTERFSLALSAEESSGVFYDRDVLGSQTPILLVATLKNPASQERNIRLTWRITDARGKTLWERNGTFSMTANSQIVRRELFDPPARGGFLLETTATARLRGADAVQKATLPFAVLTAPPAKQAQGLRPQSFFVLSTPATLSGAQLDFYSRLGARVLRSALPPDPMRPDWPALETQLVERIKRNLSTIAQIPLDEKRSAQLYFGRQIPANLARFGSLQTWELSGDVSSEDVDAWSQVLRSRRRDVGLLGPIPANLPPLPNGASLRLSALDAATFGWPQGIQTHPAALRRLWLSRADAARNAGLSAFHLRRDTLPDLKAPEAAASLTQDYLSAIMAGASSMSELLAPPSGNLASAVSMVRAAAFAMLSRTLEDAAFKEQLFPQSPALEGALFSSPGATTAVLYAPLGGGRMTVRAAPTKVLDAFGNIIARDQNGVVSFPIGAEPIYLVSQTTSEVLSYALKNARFAGLAPFRAQILPLSRDPGKTTSGTRAVRVRLQNVGVGSKTGRLRLEAPKGWKLTARDLDFTLGQGEAKTFEFRAIQSAFESRWGDSVPFRLEISGAFAQQFALRATVASAQYVAKEFSPRVDGSLGDWSNALWQNTAPNTAGVRARVAMKWDSTNLYLAARVSEVSLQARRPDDSSYEFWKGYDALQIAFGFDGSEKSAPHAGPFRDSDRGFLLSPFVQRGPRDFEGRVLALFAPRQDLNYGRIVDRVRWGGNISGSKLAFARDENAQTTIYEAQIPLAAVPELQPESLAARDGVVRFGWILHNDEGAPLDWGRSTGNFSWWDNTSTFLPSGVLTSSLRATLGFSPPDFAPSPSPTPAVPKTIPTPLTTPLPRQQNTPSPSPTPTPALPPAIVPLPLSAPASRSSPAPRAIPTAPSLLPLPPLLLPPPAPRSDLMESGQILPANPQLLPSGSLTPRRENGSLAPFLVR